MCISVAIGIDPLDIDDLAGRHTAPRHVRWTVGMTEPGGWALGARRRGRRIIVPTPGREHEGEDGSREQPPHPFAVTTRVPAGRGSSPLAGLNRIA